MGTLKKESGECKTDKNTDLFGRVASILDYARANTVRAINHNMLIAYWLIGREIVEELQQGDERAEYGKQVVEELSAKLTKRYGKGFSTTNLWYFRQFYQAFSGRTAILHPTGGESEAATSRNFAAEQFESIAKPHPKSLMGVRPRQ